MDNSIYLFFFKEQIYQLNDDSVRILKEWIDERDKILYKMGIKEDALFISKYGKRIDPQTIYYTVVKYSEKVNVNIASDYERIYNEIINEEE